MKCYFDERFFRISLKWIEFWIHVEVILHNRNKTEIKQSETFPFLPSSVTLFRFVTLAAGLLPSALYRIESRGERIDKSPYSTAYVFSVLSHVMNFKTLCSDTVGETRDGCNKFCFNLRKLLNVAVFRPIVSYSSVQTIFFSTMRPWNL